MLSGFLKSVEKFPDQPALLVNGKQFSFAWLHEKAKAIAALLLSKPDAGSIVGIYTDNNEFTYAAVIGVLLAKKGFLPLNHKFPNERLNKLVNDSEARYILHCARSLEKVQAISSGTSLVIDEDLKPAEAVYGGIDAEQVVYILFTSGSTGVPKGIPITNKSFSSFLKAMRLRYNFNDKDRVLQAYELSFDLSIGCVFMAWDCGSMVIIPDMEGITAVSGFKAIHEHKATVVSIPPSAIFYLKKLKILGSVMIPSVHTTLFAAEALPFKLTQEWKKSATNSIIENAYGPTEATVWAVFYRLDEKTEAHTINGLCPIGKPLEGVRQLIVDENNRPVKQGERGELLLGGDQIFSGYWKNDKKTAEVIYVDDQEDRWYKTGDIVIENEEGDIVYINRKDNQVQVNGFRVELGEVEHAVKKASGCDGVAVIAKTTEDYTDLYAFIEGEFEQKGLQEKLKDTLPFYMIPRNILKVAALPVNTNGKIDRLKLQQMI